MHKSCPGGGKFENGLGKEVGEVVVVSTGGFSKKASNAKHSNGVPGGDQRQAPFDRDGPTIATKKELHLTLYSHIIIPYFGTIDRYPYNHYSRVNH